ncbi:putative NACHT and WD domain protein [Phytophthora infestans]|uniref:Putative NACHT and WD domain protein n=1 Tax=Phytophthora infestans TaxID=4787 RepID=A0A833STQ6_PHYIN|nr:putative NACHT and WD domain protein [Phytophthora infestans]
MQLFADSQTHFAAVSEDGRLKVWDVANGALQQELKERDHLSYRYTSLAWTQPKTKSKKRSGDSGLGLLALGTSSGIVVVWDLATGEVKHTLQADAAHGSGAVLTFNPQGSLLYSSSSDKHILEWNVSSGKAEIPLRFGRRVGARSLSETQRSGSALALRTLFSRQESSCQACRLL